MIKIFNFWIFIIFYEIKNYFKLNLARNLKNKLKSNFNFKISIYSINHK